MKGGLTNMSNEREIVRKTENMIDELKSVCSLNGIGNSPSEYKVISQIFLYKYLNDKFIHEVKRVDKKFNNDSTIKEVEEYLNKIEPKDYSLLLMRMNPNVAKIKKEYMISYLFNNQNTTHPEFYELFDNALLGISTDNIDIFSVKTGSKEKIKLFDSLSQYITESDKKNRFFKAIINKLVGFSFEKAFEEKYDFFATIFEYLIKDYNKDFGKYAEYYTPNSIARIIARILAPNPTQNVTLYDPAAGSGTLLLALAHQIGEDNCTIYSQDISQKSNEFLRLNLILNNLVHSLGNAIHGDTLLTPAHLNNEKNRLAQFDYIVSNPPFKTDFSETRDQLDSDKFKDRFFAGVPNIPDKYKEKMPVYLMFIQHIIYSLKEGGRAAIVVPTIFLTTEQGKIEKKLRRKIIDDNLLTMVISMPSNIFANTGTNVSILFLQKFNTDKQVLLVDAVNFGEKIKNGKSQRTIISEEEIDCLIRICNQREEIDNLSVLKSNEEIINKNYTLSASQYYSDINHYEEINYEEYINKLTLKNQIINNCFDIPRITNELIDCIYNYWFVQFDFPDKNGKPYKSNGGELIYNERIGKEIPLGWEVKSVNELLAKIPHTYKYKTSEYLNKGRYPIIDQSEKAISGYTNNSDDILDLENCIIFGDHTKKLKYINFNFARGADGTQIISSNDERLSNLLFYMQLKSYQLVSQGYSRYFKFLKEKLILIPNNNISFKFGEEIISNMENVKKIISEQIPRKLLLEFFLPGIIK
jgi:type I restriction enzyme M protein